MTWAIAQSLFSRGLEGLDLMFSPFTISNMKAF